jgi:hypothetical protein
VSAAALRRTIRRGSVERAAFRPTISSAETAGSRDSRPFHFLSRAEPSGTIRRMVGVASSSDPFETIREALDAAGCAPSGEYVIRARCPAHDSRSCNSLKVSRGDRWPIVMRCYAECATGDILKALDLPWRVLLDASAETAVRAERQGRLG